MLAIAHCFLELDAYLVGKFPGTSDIFALKAAVKDVIPLENFYLVFVQGTSRRWVAEMLCNLKSEEDVSEFVANYLRQNNETIKIRF